MGSRLHPGTTFQISAKGNPDIPLLPVLVVVLVSGCATSVLPTSYLEHRDAGRGGGMRVCWVDDAVKLSTYRNIVVREFATDKAVGVKGKIDRASFGRAIRDRLILDLRRYGRNTTTDVRTLPAGQPLLVIRGSIAQLNPGNPRDRYRIGFGAGRALVDIEAKVYRVDKGKAVLCAEFAESEGKSMGVVGETTRLLDFCIRRISRTMADYIARHGTDE